MKEEILFLRSLGHTIEQINRITGFSITEICTIISENNRADRQDSFEDKDN